MSEIVQPKIFWPGTDVEKMALMRAVKNNCGCETGPLGTKINQLGCHQLLIPDQDKWNHLVDARRRAGKMLVQELGPQRRWVPGNKYDRVTYVILNLLDRQAK